MPRQQKAKAMGRIGSKKRSSLCGREESRGSRRTSAASSRRSTAVAARRPMDSRGKWVARIDGRAAPRTGSTGRPYRRVSAVETAPKIASAGRQRRRRRRRRVHGRGTGAATRVVGPSETAGGARSRAVIALMAYFEFGFFSSTSGSEAGMGPIPVRRLGWGQFRFGGWDGANSGWVGANSGSEAGMGPIPVRRLGWGKHKLARHSLAAPADATPARPANSPAGPAPPRERGTNGRCCSPPVEAPCEFAVAVASPQDVEGPTAAEPPSTRASERVSGRLVGADGKGERHER
eukprot:scaffold13896_cov120-Isochrysis_galbana.AAC.10